MSAEEFEQGLGQELAARMASLEDRLSRLERAYSENKRMTDDNFQGIEQRLSALKEFAGLEARLDALTESFEAERTSTKDILKTLVDRVAEHARELSSIDKEARNEAKQLKAALKVSTDELNQSQQAVYMSLLAAIKAEADKERPDIEKVQALITLYKEFKSAL